MSQINYRNQETVKSAFFHSCLGKLTILGGILILILAIAYSTNPTEQEMAVEMEDNVMQCLEENDLAFRETRLTTTSTTRAHLTKADTTKIFPDLIQSYRALNLMEIYHHSLYTTSYLFNNMRILRVSALASEALAWCSRPSPSKTFSSQCRTYA